MTGMVFARSMRRKTPIGEYPRGTYRIERAARPDQVVEWIKDRVATDGGKASFVGFGRWARRLFGKAQSLLPAEYQAQLIRPTSIGGRPGQPTWREKRHEWRLIVTHGHDPKPPAVPRYPD